MCAQRQYTTYQADILSFELRDALLGVLMPGRYRGYNLMAEYDTQVGDNVYCRFTHPAGISKYDQDSPPVLEAKRGIAITTQGTIIAEDGNVDVTVVLINGGASDTVVHLLYMEHVYDGAVPGANNATYGIKSGTEGGGIPSLTSPTKQVIIGYIIEPIGAAQFSNLTYYRYYPGIGDEGLYKILFQKDNLGGIDMGTYPSSDQGVIGNRNFSGNNYLTDFNSITEALSALDTAIKARADAIDDIPNTKLDDWATPDDNTDLDVHSDQHGLCPKLPPADRTLKYLRGDGQWVIPLGGKMVMRTGAFDTVVTYNSASPDENLVDLQGIVPTDADVAIIRIHLHTANLAAGSAIIVAARVDEGGYSYQGNIYNYSDSARSPSMYDQFLIPLVSNRYFYFYIMGGKPYVDQIGIACVGWQTYS